MALIDTGPLVALIDPQDARHRAATRALLDEPGRVVTTWAVITEALYLLGRGRDPWYRQQPLIERIGLGGIVVDDLTVDLGTCSLSLMKTYADVPMSLADASLVALAEQPRELRIVTFDSDSACTERAMGSRQGYSMALAERAAAIFAPALGQGIREAIQSRAHLKRSRHVIGKSDGFRVMRTPRGQARVEELLRLLGELAGHLELHSIDVQFPSTADLRSPSTGLRTNDRLLTLTRRNNGRTVSALSNERRHARFFRRNPP